MTAVSHRIQSDDAEQGQATRTPETATAAGSSLRWEDVETALQPSMEGKKSKLHPQVTKTVTKKTKNKRGGNDHEPKEKQAKRPAYQQLAFLPPNPVNTGAPRLEDFEDESPPPAAADNNSSINNNPQQLTWTLRQEKEMAECDAISRAIANSNLSPTDDGRPGAYSTVPGSKPSRRTYAPTQSVINEAAHDEEEAAALFTSRIHTTTNNMVRSPRPQNDRITHSSNLAVANMISERSEQDMPVAEAMEATDQRQAQRKETPVYVKGVLCTVVLATIVGVILIVVFVVRNNQGETDANMPTFTSSPTISCSPTTSPSASPSISPEGYVWSILPNYTKASIRQKEGSPQDLAFQWVREDPSLWNYSRNRIHQRFALATFYHATGGSQHWTYDKDWLSYDVHECNWYLRSTFLPPTDETNTDVTPPCNEQEQFEHLWQWASKMIGNLAVEFFWITSLKTINLQKQTSLGGTIPSQIGLCSHLDHLTLSDNMFTSMPTIELGRLTALRSFSIFNNLLGESISTEIGMMESLEYLDLSHNSLQLDLPSELGQLKKLKSLALVNNIISSSIPKEFGELSSLESLQLNENFLWGPLRSELGQLKNLTTLLVNYNSLTGTIPTELAALSNLERLHIYGNNLWGTLPTSVCELPLLSRPKVDCFEVECPIGCECDCRDAEPAAPPGAPFGGVAGFDDPEHDDNTTGYAGDEFDYGDGLGDSAQPRPTDGLVDPLPSYTVSALYDPFSPQSKALDWLDAHPLNATFPAWKKTQLFAVVTFYFSYDGDDWNDGDRENWLSTSVDECLWSGNACNGEGKITMLSLQSQSEFVQGVTPPELALLTSLETLNIFDMHLSRSLETVLPLELTSLTNFSRAHLNSNRLTLSLSDYVGEFQQLTSLQLHSQSFTGSLPTTLGLLENLRFLSLYRNFFTGQLPSELGLVTTLEELSVHSTDLTGTVPEVICALPALSSLQVSCLRVACPIACSCTCDDEL